MKEFMMIFRSTPNSDFKPSPEQLQEVIKQWQDWIGSIAAQGKFTSTNQLGSEGKILKPGNVVTDGPYVALKEIVGGYIVVKANGMEDAMEMAKGCPVLQIGGNVEVRNLMEIDI